MKTESELDRLLKETRPLIVDRSLKGVVFSDLHLGVKTPADDFCKNEDLFRRVFDDYWGKGFLPFFAGDIIDLWENPDEGQIRAAYPSIVRRIDPWPRAKGTHDGELMLPEALLLEYVEDGKRILMLHGHQGDFFNQSAYPLGKFVVRHIWRNLQLLGLKDPTTGTSRNPKKHESVKMAIQQWAQDRQQTVIFGHTHFAESVPPYYYNCGSWVGKGGQCVEIEGNEIRVKSFE